MREVAIGDEMQAFERRATTIDPGWLLSPQEMQTYRQDGLVRPDLAFTENEVTDIRTLLDTTLANVGSQQVNTKPAEREIYLVRGEDWTDKTNLVDLRL